MDANTIRLILIVVGALLILLLYLWERHREKAEEAGADEFEDEAGFADDDEEDSPYGVRTDKREPRLGALNDADEPPVAPRSSSPKAAKPSVAESKEDAPPPRPRSAAPAEAPLEPLLIQVSVSARRAHFKGAELLDVAETCGLHPGDMDIFHCLDEFEDETRIYFSMANMVKPGTFPFDDMDDFTTPGLMLFAQLEGDPEDMTILEEMIAAANKLAIALNGDVLDDTRRPLTVNKEEAMRKAVLANERRWAQAYPQ